jgi:arylsulfatase A-like enzyme
MASVAAGVPPGMHGAVQAEYSLCDAAETLAERFHAAGWTTGFAGSNTYLEPPDAGYAQGFEFYWARGSETAERVLDYARLFLDGAGKSPIFLHVHFFDPHCPYTPSAGAAAAVTARNFGPTGGPLSAHLPPIGPAVDDSRLCHVVPPIDFALPEKEQIARPRSGQRQDYLDAYDGELRDVDGAIATLAGILEERGRWDGAWIALTGDHGEEFAEHGRLGHGRHLYRESTWVPLLLRPPRDEAAPPVARVQVPVSLVDLTPTLAIAAGLSPSPSWTGRDLLGASGGPPPGEAEGLAGAIFAETNDEGRQRLLEWDGHRLVLDGSGSEAKEQLFDARADPMDLRDLLHESGGPPGAALLDKASRMRAELDRLEALHASRRICTPGTVAADPIREEQLRALGYAGGKPP